MLNAIVAESNAVVKAASLVPSVGKNYLNMQALIQQRDSVLRLTNRHTYSPTI